MGRAREKKREKKYLKKFLTVLPNLVRWKRKMKDGWMAFNKLLKQLSQLKKDKKRLEQIWTNYSCQAFSCIRNWTIYSKKIPFSGSKCWPFTVSFLFVYLLYSFNFNHSQVLKQDLTSYRPSWRQTWWPIDRLLSKIVPRCADPFLLSHTFQIQKELHSSSHILNAMQWYILRRHPYLI